MGITNEEDRIRQVSNLLYSATQSIRILSHVGWDDSVRTQFFEKGARELPIVSYPEFDASKPIELVAEARRHIKDSSVDEWLGRHATNIENSARMLSTCGTPDYFEYSSLLYGKPLDVSQDQVSTPHALAVHFDEQIQSLAHIDLGAPRAACYLADAVAADMSTAVKAMFKNDAP